MVGRNPRYEIDIMIIQALEENSQLRYIDIQEKINLRCERLGLKKPSTDTITNRLKILRKKDVLHKEEGMYGCTHYSLKMCYLYVRFADMYIQFTLNLMTTLLNHWRIFER
jgi:DNA-binding Lrp family transcriptional regulator